MIEQQFVEHELCVANTLTKPFLTLEQTHIKMVYTNGLILKAYVNNPREQHLE